MAAVSPAEILDLTEALLRRHGLDLPIRWSRARTSLAAVMFDRRSGRALELRLSRVLLPRLSCDVVRDAVLHEIAHVEAGVDAGHGPQWRAAAARLGARPDRTTHLPESVRAAVARYRARCRRCGGHVYMHRRPKYGIDAYRHAPQTCGGRLRPLERLR